MNQQPVFAPDSFYKTHAIPVIPYSFKQSTPTSAKFQSQNVDWGNMLSYKHPLHNLYPRDKSVFVEEHKSYFGKENLTAIPFEKEYAYKQPDILVAILLLLVVVLSIIRAFFQRYLRQFFYATFLYSESVRLHNDQNATLPSLYAWLNALAIVTFSVVVYLFFIHYNLYESLGRFMQLAISILLVMGYFILRSLIIKISGWILDQRTVFREYLFHYLLYYKAAAIFMLPVLFVTIFCSKAWTEYMLIILLVLFIMAHLWIYGRATKIFLKKGFFIFYWILYLCTAEITPFLLLYKYISSEV